MTFFALDKENVENYRSALDNQSEFLTAMNELVDGIKTMLDEYEAKQD